MLYLKNIGICVSDGLVTGF